MGFTSDPTPGSDLYGDDRTTPYPTIRCSSPRHDIQRMRHEDCRNAVALRCAITYREHRAIAHCDDPGQEEEMEAIESLAPVRPEFNPLAMLRGCSWVSVSVHRAVPAPGDTPSLMRAI